MSDTVTPICPRCAQAIDIKRGRIVLVCKHCDADLIVSRTGAVVSLVPIVEAIDRVHAGPAATDPATNRTRLRSEILDLLSEIDQVRRNIRAALITSLRLTAAGSVGLFLALPLDWLHWLAVPTGLVIAVGLYGLYDHFIGKSREARQMRLESAVAEKWTQMGRQPKPIETQAASNSANNHQPSAYAD